MEKSPYPLAFSAHVGLLFRFFKSYSTSPAFGLDRGVSKV